MKQKAYHSMDSLLHLDRRDFLRVAGLGTAAAAGGIVLGIPAFGQDKQPPPPVETNIADFQKVPRTKHSLPGPFPGKVVEVTDERSLSGGKIDPAVVAQMVEKGITALTGHNMKKSFRLLFTRQDVVGLKVNPVGPPLINTKLEILDAVIKWLVDGGIPRNHIVIWDRFDYMLKDAGYTKDRFPGVRIEGLQTMDEEGDKWRDAQGNHVSAGNFDREAYYFAKGVQGRSVAGYKDDAFYLNQHVFNGEYSYFGKLVTRDLTRIINLPVFKNTGNGISMATKNMGYGAVCNTGRLHAPLGFKVCTEVLAAPPLRDKLALNITDGLRGQYDGGPMMNEQFVYPHQTLYFATDPFALDAVCQRQMTDKRKAMGVAVSDNPRFTEYLRYAEQLGLGVADLSRIRHVQLKA